MKINDQSNVCDKIDIKILKLKPMGGICFTYPTQQLDSPSDISL